MKGEEGKRKGVGSRLDAAVGEMFRASSRNHFNKERLVYVLFFIATVIRIVASI